MRIAVPYEDGQVFQHFGHTSQMKVYDIAGGKIVQEQLADASGSGHSALAGFLADLQADTVICGGIGAGAREALAREGTGRRRDKGVSCRHAGISGRRAVRLFRQSLRPRDLTSSPEFYIIFSRVLYDKRPRAVFGGD